MMSDVPDTRVDEVRLQMPASTSFLRLARLNATAFGTALDFDVDGLEDLRMAVNEAVSWLLEEATGAGTVEVTLRGSDGQLEIAGCLDGTVGSDEVVDVDDLVGAILGATVDHFALRTGGSRSFELTKVATRHRDG
jgi:hypothetical protein